jgi:hypothetical protein
MLNVFVTAVLAFLGGMAVGIAGYCFTTLVAWEKEIEAIFDRVVAKYEAKITRYKEENKRLHDSLMEVQVKLARKEKKA